MMTSQTTKIVSKGGYCKYMYTRVEKISILQMNKGCPLQASELYQVKFNLLRDTNYIPLLRSQNHE